MGTQVQSITKCLVVVVRRRPVSSPRSSLTRSVRLSPSLTPMLPAPLTSVSSRPPCVPLASRSRTRSSRRWSPTSTTTATAPLSYRVPPDDDWQDGREGLPRGHREGVQALRRRQHQQDLLPQPRPCAEELGENIDDEELQDMINQAGRDGDGEINIDEFYRIMKKKGNFLEDLSSDDDF